MQTSYVAKHITEQCVYQRSLHFHDTNEVLFTLNGNCSLFLDDQVYSIQEGALSIIPEGTIHHKTSPNGISVDSYTIHIPTLFLSLYSSPQTDLKSAFSSTPICVQLPESLIATVTDRFEHLLSPVTISFGSDLERNIRLLSFLLSIYPFLSTDRRSFNIRSSISPLVSDVLAYINAHSNEHLSLDRLSSTFFLSKYNLCRQFKRETGFTIVEYINSTRIRQACNLLRTDQPIETVGKTVGFPNKSHFTHTFRKFTDETPRNYQKRYRNFADVPMINTFSPGD